MSKTYVVTKDKWSDATGKRDILYAGQDKFTASEICETESGYNERGVMLETYIQVWESCEEKYTTSNCQDV